jgi:hypothetical protein
MRTRTAAFAGSLVSGAVGGGELEGDVEDGGEFAGDADVAEAVAAVAGDFDIDDGVVAMRFDGFDGETGAGEGVGDGLGGRQAGGEKILEPLEADFHAVVLPPQWQSFGAAIFWNGNLLGRQSFNVRDREEQPARRAISEGFDKMPIMGYCGCSLVF